MCETRQDAPDALHVIVCGAHGRMGSRTCALIERTRDVHLVARITRDGIERIADAAGDSARSVVIDFSTDNGARDAARYARGNDAALLTATTALGERTLEEVRAVSVCLPVIIAPNTSFGVAVIEAALSRVAPLLTAGFDVDIIDTHHKAKRDAPSGTALRLAGTIAEHGDFDASALRDRMHAIRAGDIVGQHEIVFTHPAEVIRISHAAQTRDVFAHGALRAARWLSMQKPGMYTIQDAWEISAAIEAPAHVVGAAP